MADEKKYSIFDYVVYLEPEPEDEDDNPKPEIIDGPNTVVASSPQEIAMRAARDLPDEYEDRLDEVEIAVRPW